MPGIATLTQINRHVNQLLTDAVSGVADVSGFWDVVAHETTPLIDSIPSDPEHLLVTYVWRQTSDHVAAVVLQGAPIWHESDQVRDNPAGFIGATSLRHVEGTDVWWRSYVTRTDLCAIYAFQEFELAPTVATIEADSKPDPLNPQVWPTQPPSTPAIPDWSDDAPWPYVSLPDAPHDPALPPRAGSPSGRLERIDLPNSWGDRRVWVYQPPSFDSTASYPVLILNDGWHWTWPECSIATIVDNLIAAGDLPPMMVVAQESPNGHREELACSNVFVDFLADELLPFIRSRWPVTTDPRQTIIAGQSYGGLSAAFAALRRPETFGQVISQSGSFWYPSGTDFDQQAGSLMRRFADSERLPLVFHLHVGLLEQWMVPVNRHFRDVLVAKGYPVSYREYLGGHSWLNWRQEIPTTLRTIARQWQTLE